MVLSLVFFESQDNKNETKPKNYGIFVNSSVISFHQQKSGNDKELKNKTK